jgi:hypothetical protein
MLPFLPDKAPGRNERLYFELRDAYLWHFLQTLPLERVHGVMMTVELRNHRWTRGQHLLLLLLCIHQRRLNDASEECIDVTLALKESHFAAG